MPLQYLAMPIWCKDNNSDTITGLVGVISTAICLTYIDKTGRKKPLAWVSVGLTIDMILLMVFSKYYANSDNKVGQGFTIAWIFVFSFIFSLG